MVEKGDLVATVSRKPDGLVVVTWLLGGIGATEWPSVREAKRSVDERWVKVAWEEVTPFEWWAREA